MALIVGVGLATLVFVGIPLQLVHNRWPWTAVVQIIGTVHGVFYIVYLLTCLDLASRARFRLVQLLAMVASGLVPLLAFYMENLVSKRVRAQLAMGANRPPSTAAAVWSAVARRDPD
jgi:integral membrane protein